MAKTKKIPNRIAGMKLPKRLRRGLRDLTATENGRIVLMEALATAAGSAKAVKAEPGAKTGKRRKPEAAPPPDAAAPSAAAPAETPPPVATTH